MLISHFFLYLSFRKKMFVFKRNMTHVFKLSLFFNQFSHVSSAVLFLFFSFIWCKEKYIKKKEKQKKMCSFDQPFSLFFFEKQEMFFSAFSRAKSFSCAKKGFLSFRKNVFILVFMTFFRDFSRFLFTHLFFVSLFSSVFLPFSS